MIRLGLGRWYVTLAVCIAGRGFCAGAGWGDGAAIRRSMEETYGDA